MANPDHIRILSQGIKAWNKWRNDYPFIPPDLSGEFVGGYLHKNHGKIKGHSVDVTEMNLRGVNFSKCSLEAMHLNNIDLTGSNFYEADLSRVKLQNADLTACNFRKAYMSYADLEGANLSKVNLNRASLINANLCGAQIQDSIVFGTSVWGIKTDEKTIQRNLFLVDTNDTGESLVEFFRTQNPYPLTVDDIEIAQFIHLMTNNKNLGKALNAMLDKGVLILGKFSGQGRGQLEFIAEILRARNFIPIIFDFQNPAENTIIETVGVLAGISRYIIVDLSGPSVPAELERITSNYTRPIISLSNAVDEHAFYSMFMDVLKKKEVLFLKYSSPQELETKLDAKLKEAEIIMHQITKENSEAALIKLKNG